MALFISFLAGVTLFYFFQYFPFISSFIFLISAIFLVFRKRYPLVLGIVAGIFYAFLRYTPDSDISHIRGKEMLVSGTCVSGAVETLSGKFIQTFYVDLSSEPSVSGREVNIISDAEFEIGNRYELTVKAIREATRLSPGMMKNENLYANLIGISYQDGRGEGVHNADKGSGTSTLQRYWPLMRLIFENARARINRYITENFSPDSGALVAAITTGRRADMSPDLKDAFNSSGLAHILSISGTHFGLFSVFLFGVFRFLIKHLPYRLLQRVTIYITPSQGAAILCIPLMLGYLGLSGLSIPAIRAFVMIAMFLAGLLIGRKGFWLNSLLFAAFVIVLWSPDALFSLSFQLSFLAVLFIGLTVGYMREDKESAAEQQDSRAVGQEVSKTSKLLSYCVIALRSSLFLTLAASFGTAILVAYHFHYFSVISPLSNLIITPFIGFVLLPLSLFSSFVFLFTGDYLLGTLISAIADIAVYLVMKASHLPFADIKIPAFPAGVVIFFYAVVAVYFIFGRNKKDDVAQGNKNLPIPRYPFSEKEETTKNSNGWRKYFQSKYIVAILLGIIMLCLFIPVFGKKQGISVTFLDVGQGDSAVVELPDRNVIVIDTGRNGKETAAFLKYQGKKTIDALVLSHSHPDHSGGADYLIEKFRVKELWDNGRLIYPEGMLNSINHRILERGDVISSAGYEIYVLHPYREFYTIRDSEYDEGNNSSLVLKIKGRERSFLFAGDIEEEAEDDIAHLWKWLESDIIKVPHHGGRTSASEWFLETVSPRIAVISAGRDNAFGHPHQETLDMLENAKIYRTDMDGAIKITEKDDRLEVRTYKDFQFEKAKTINAEMRNLKRLFEVW